MGRPWKCLRPHSTNTDSFGADGALGMNGRIPAQPPSRRNRSRVAYGAHKLTGCSSLSAPNVVARGAGDPGYRFAHPGYDFCITPDYAAHATLQSEPRRGHDTVHESEWTQ